MIHLRNTIEAKGMKQAEAAKLFGVTRPRVSDLYKGKTRLFSIDTLVDMLARACLHFAQGMDGVISKREKSSA